jgi:outer membrane protein assembly factor BamA
VKGYFGTRAEVTFPELADGRLFLQGYADHRDYPQEDYFGLGPDSLRANQTSFAQRGEAFGGRIAYQPVRSHVYIGSRLELQQQRIGSGKDKALPSIEEIFDDQTAPGLAAQPDFLRTSLWVEVDYRRPRYARNGGWYRLEYNHFDDRTLGAYTFNRLDLDVRQAVSFLGERRVLWGRVAASTSDVAAGQTVPFYEMYTLGGNSTLRGFRDYRFRGPHALLLQGEYRIEVWSALDLAFFYDAGKVAMERSDLDFSNLERDYGFGFRFNSDNGIILRIDAAFGSNDGKHLWIVFGGVF